MRLASLWVLLLLLSSAEAFASVENGEPGLVLTAPANFTYIETSDDPGHPAYNPGHPNVDVIVVYAVDEWAWPTADRSVHFFLDEDALHPIRMTRAPSGEGVTVTGIPPGLHTLTACLAWREDTSAAWMLVVNQPEEDPHTGDPRYTGTDACTSLTLRVSIIGCNPSAFFNGAYVCDPFQDEATCCVDANPCSVDNCVWTTILDGSGSEYKCRYGPAPASVAYGACCQSDFDCARGERCYQNDKPTISADDGLVNHCYECDRFSRGLDTTCDDGDICTIDTCNDDWFCAHARILSSVGGPCCVSTADCDDKDPCTIDTCAQFNAELGHGYCAFDSAVDLSATELAGIGYASDAFEGCCVPGKEFAYCDEHQVVLDGELVQDACWDVACIGHQCRYGKNLDPLCCTADHECADCAVYDEDGSCAELNACTSDACVEHHCEFSWNPIPPPDADCCQQNEDCVDEDPCTIDWCGTFACLHRVDPLCCVPDAVPPVLCPPDPNPCLAYACSEEAHCELVPNPAHPAPQSCCMTDADCDTGDACTEDACDLGTNTCEHQPVALTGGKPCCNTSLDCFDGDICTDETCVANQCHYGLELIDPSECASGRCCGSGEDLDGDGSADACEVAGSCGLWACMNHCCVSTKALADDACLTDADCDDGDVFSWLRCVDCVCVPQAPVLCDEASDPCDDSKPCTLDACDIKEGRCAYVPVIGCCVANSDCIPALPDPCTNYHCVPSQNICQNTYMPHCCASDDDPKCDDGDGCTSDPCVHGKCRHLTMDPACCESASDCNDGRACTLDACLGGVCVNALRDYAPDGTRCCETSLVCGDPSDVCKEHFCIGNACVSMPVAGCCTESGVLDPSCDDGNPYTYDWCLYGQCRYLPFGP
jgi:hypothetical protein